MDRYIGLDTHSSSCTLGVLGPSGKRLGLHVVETNAQALIDVLLQHSGTAASVLGYAELRIARPMQTSGLCGVVPEGRVIEGDLGGWYSA